MKENGKMEDSGSDGGMDEMESILEGLALLLVLVNMMIRIKVSIALCLLLVVSLLVIFCCY